MSGEEVARPTSASRLKMKKAPKFKGPAYRSVYGDPPERSNSLPVSRDTDGVARCVVIEPSQPECRLHRLHRDHGNDLADANDRALAPAAAEKPSAAPSPPLRFPAGYRKYFSARTGMARSHTTP